MKVVIVPRYADENEVERDLEPSEALSLIGDGQARLADDEPVPDQVAALADGTYDPSEHNVDDVVAHLQASGSLERERVIAAEAAGKKRSTITGWQPTDGEGESA